MAQEVSTDSVTENHIAKEQKLDPAKIIMEHKRDNDEFHFLPLGTKKSARIFPCAYSTAHHFIFKRTWLCFVFFFPISTQWRRNGRGIV